MSASANSNEALSFRMAKQLANKMERGTLERQRQRKRKHDETRKERQSNSSKEERQKQQRDDKARWREKKRIRKDLAKQQQSARVAWWEVQGESMEAMAPNLPPIPTTSNLPTPPILSPMWNPTLFHLPAAPPLMPFVPFTPADCCAFVPPFTPPYCHLNMPPITPNLLMPLLGRTNTPTVMVTPQLSSNLQPDNASFVPMLVTTPNHTPPPNPFKTPTCAAASQMIVASPCHVTPSPTQESGEPMIVNNIRNRNAFESVPLTPPQIETAATPAQLIVVDRCTPTASAAASPAPNQHPEPLPPNNLQQTMSPLQDKLIVAAYPRRSKRIAARNPRRSRCISERRERENTRRRQSEESQSRQPQRGGGRRGRRNNGRGNSGGGGGDDDGSDDDDDEDDDDEDSNDNDGDDDPNDHTNQQEYPSIEQCMQLLCNNIDPPIALNQHRDVSAKCETQSIFSNEMQYTHQSLSKQIRKMQENFVKNTYKNAKMKFCCVCHEARFDLLGTYLDGGRRFKCKQCISPQNNANANNNRHVPPHSHHNKMDPFIPANSPDGAVQWTNLPTPLTEIEEMLIALAFPVMKIIRLDNGSIAYQGSVVNFNQEVNTFVSVLPNLPGDLPVFRVCRNNPTNDAPPRQFNVRRQPILAWLRFLKQNNPLYQDVRISEANLCEIPENGNIYFQLQGPPDQANDENNVNDNANANVNVNANANNNNDDNDNDDNDNDDNGNDDLPDRTGPEQGGASGLLREDMQNELEDSHLEAPQASVNIQQQIVNRLQANCGTRTNPIQWPEQGEALNEYTTPNIQAMAFPTLFPFATGDATNNDRYKIITMAQANAHLLNYAIKQQDNTLTFPFAQHRRWIHWAQNFAERHRHLGQCSIFTKKKMT